MYHIKPNIYVISAQSEKGDHNIFVYYEYSGKKEDPQEIDVRYLRENGTRLADVYLDTEMVLNYVPKDHAFNSRLGSEFSVFQENWGRHLRPPCVSPYYPLKGPV